MSVIEIEHLTQDYGHGRGIFDVTFSVEKGEVFGFLGPNGAGKSTTIRHIMGFSKPQSGSIKVFGLDAFKYYYKILGNVGYLPGEIALPEGLSGWEFIDMMSKLRGINDKERLNYLLNKFKLNPTGETKKMSLGDKRKLAIVTAFMSDPEVLILDEPTSGLDPVMQQVFIDFVKEEKKRGKTILLSSHIFNEVEATCDRIAIIKDGRIVSNFDTKDITQNKIKTFEITFKNKEQLDEFCKDMPKFSPNLKNYKDIYIKEKNIDNLTVALVLNDDDIDKLVAKISKFDVALFKQIKYTLEDYFMHFYKEDKDFSGALKNKKEQKIDKNNN